MTFWDLCAPLYDFAERRNRKAREGMLREISGIIPPGARVLELAAGTGFIGLAVAGKAGAVTITDMSENMLSVARRKAKRMGLSGVAFQTCDICDTGFPDGAFDVIIAAQVLHLLDEPETAAAEMRRISKDMVIAPVCLLKNLKAGARLKVAVFRLLGFRPKREFDEESYREFLTAVGLPPAGFSVAGGDMPMAVAVWRKKA